MLKLVGIPNANKMMGILTALHRGLVRGLPARGGTTKVLYWESLLRC